MIDFNFADFVQNIGVFDEGNMKILIADLNVWDVLLLDNKCSF